MGAIYNLNLNAVATNWKGLRVCEKKKYACFSVLFRKNQIIDSIKSIVR